MAKKTLSAEDSALFRNTIGKVKAVESDNLILSTDKKPKPYPKQRPLNRQNSFTDAVEVTTEKLYQEDSISFLAPGLQKNILKKLRKGFFGFDATLDLHGLTSREAQYQLSQFIHFSIEDGFRCIHIIHGKGYRSENKQPILKNDINVWLRQHKAVQAFCSTPPKDGGTGAVFVLLKLSEKYSEQENP